MVGREIGTVVKGIKNRIGILKEAAYWRKDDVYRFVFENGWRLEISSPVFFHHTILRLEDNCIWFGFSPAPVLSGILAYSLFETYGLPLVFTADEMEKHGMPVDEEGFRIMEMLGHERSRNTFRGKDAFR
jgi:hypothetical protein